MCQNMDKGLVADNYLKYKESASHGGLLSRGLSDGNGAKMNRGTAWPGNNMHQDLGLGDSPSSLDIRKGQFGYGGSPVCRGLEVSHLP